MRPIGKRRLYSHIPVPCNATMTTFTKKKPGTDSVKMLEDRWQHLVFLSITVTPMYLAGLVEITRQQHWGLLTWKCVFAEERTVASLNSSFPLRIVVISTYTSLWDWIAIGVIVVRGSRLHLHYNNNNNQQQSYTITVTGRYEIQSSFFIWNLLCQKWPGDLFGAFKLCGDFNFFLKKKKVERCSCGFFWGEVLVLCQSCPFSFTEINYVIT